MKYMILILLVVSLTIAPSVGANVADSLDFSTNMAEMKGHLDMAVLLLKEGDVDGAVPHAGHPVEEYWALIGGRVKEKDQELFRELDRELAELPNVLETANPWEFEGKVKEVFDLLNQAEALVVPEEIRAGFIFKARVIISLLETARAEYSAGISETGEVKMIQEYQDSTAFIKRAEGMFGEIRSVVGEKEAREIDGFFRELRVAFEAREPPSKIGVMVNGIVNKLEESADIAEGGRESPDIIDEIDALLQQVVEAYEEKRYDKADELAIRAYLENYEIIEGQLNDVDARLNSEIEQAMRVQLRQMLKDRAPATEIEKLVDEITENLEKARELLGEGAPPGREETVKQVARPQVKEEKASMAPWYGAVAVLLGISIAEGVAIARLRRKE